VTLPPGSPGSPTSLPAAAPGMQALKRVAQPDDIGGAIAFLASDDARLITRDTIRVGGGSKL
jgi:3-oxoacyl-[acyl-carrier protein] reductase